MANNPLGSVAIDDETFEHDVTLLDRYLAFSAELARLAILAIGAVGYLITNNAFNSTKRRRASRSVSVLSRSVLASGS